MSCEVPLGLLSRPGILLQLAAVGMFFSRLPWAPGLCHTPSSSTGLSSLVSQSSSHSCVPDHHWALLQVVPGGTREVLESMEPFSVPELGFVRSGLPYHCPAGSTPSAWVLYPSQFPLLKDYKTVAVSSPPGTGSRGKCQQPHSAWRLPRGQGQSCGEDTKSSHVGVLDLGVLLKVVPLLHALQAVGLTWPDSHSCCTLNKHKYFRQKHGVGPEKR